MIRSSREPEANRSTQLPGSRRVERDANNQPQITRSQGRSNDYRSGYVHYSNQWRDDWFWYPHYGFQYSQDRCVPSPFYFYSHLPAYVSVGRVTVIFNSPVIINRCRERYSYRPIRVNWNTGWGSGWNTGWGNGWDGDDWGGNGNRDWDRNDLDRSIDDIIIAFNRGSVRPMSSMIPARDRILIDIDDDARYTLSGDDFYDMMQDLVGGTRTTGYRIRDVRTDRGYATVVAQHEYRDSWGSIQRKIHVYGLEEDRRGYTIREFSVRRSW
jgi:hypothetical protein